LSRSVYYYESCKDDSAVAEKLQDLAVKKPMEGQDMFYKRIRREGILWNHKRVSRVYRLMGLNKKKRTRKRIPARVKQPLVVPSMPNQTWSMDFMADRLMNGRRFRVLNIIDDYNRGILRIEPYLSITSERVISIIDRLIRENKKPLAIRVDNGPEFIAEILNEWCKDKDIDLRFIQPGRPMQNGYIERFNRSYRQDVLDANLFTNLTEVKLLSDEFEEDYNFHRPHESLGDLTPVEYRLKHALI
jgi:putative transposase